MFYLIYDLDEIKITTSAITKGIWQRSELPELLYCFIIFCRNNGVTLTRHNYSKWRSQEILKMKKIDSKILFFFLKQTVLHFGKFHKEFDYRNYFLREFKQRRWLQQRERKYFAIILSCSPSTIRANDPVTGWLRTVFKVQIANKWFTGVCSRCLQT